MGGGVIWGVGGLRVTGRKADKGDGCCVWVVWVGRVWKGLHGIGFVVVGWG